MSVSGPQQEDNEATLQQPDATGQVGDATHEKPGATEGDATGKEPDAAPNGVVEIDERRVKMERLLGEGIDPTRTSACPTAR